MRSADPPELCQGPGCNETTPLAGAAHYAVVLTTDDEAQPAKSLRLTGAMERTSTE